MHTSGSLSASPTATTAAIAVATSHPLRRARRPACRHARTLAGAEALGEWADVWLPVHKAKVSASTYGTDAGRMNKWVLLGLKDVKLRDLTPVVVERFFAALKTDGGQSDGERHRVGKVLRK